MDKRIILAGLMICMLTGCIAFGQPDGPKNEISVQPTSKTAPKVPSFMIVRPSPDETYHTFTQGVDLTLVLAPAQLTLSKEGTRATYGEGHFAVTLDGGDTIHTHERAHLFENLEKGKHTIAVEFLNNDFTPYNPRIVRTVDFEIVAEAPATLEKKLSVSRNGFDEKELVLDKIQTLVIANEGPTPQTIRITSSTGMHVGSKYLKPHERFEHLFSQTGTYYITVPGKEQFKTTTIVE